MWACRLRSWATAPGNCCSTTSARARHAREANHGVELMRLTRVFPTVFRSISFALGLLCASTSFAADGPGLVDAARNGNVDAVRTLLKGGADPNQSAPDGSTAVHW